MDIAGSLISERLGGSNFGKAELYKFALIKEAKNRRVNIVVLRDVSSAGEASTDDNNAVNTEE